MKNLNLMKAILSFQVWLVLKIHLKRVSQKPSTNANKQESLLEWSQVISKKLLQPLPKTPTSFHTVMKDLKKDNQDIMLLCKENNSEKLLVVLLKIKTKIKIMLEILRYLKKLLKNLEYLPDHHHKTNIYWLLD